MGSPLYRDPGSASHSRQHLFNSAHGFLIPLVECPLLYLFPANQAGICQHIQVLARAGLRDPELAGDKTTAHSVLHQVAIPLRRKVFAWILQPVEHPQAPLIRQRAQNDVNFHIDN